MCNACAVECTQHAAPAAEILMAVAARSDGQTKGKYRCKKGEIGKSRDIAANNILGKKLLLVHGCETGAEVRINSRNKLHQTR